MAYANANNVCSFLGMLVKDPEIKTIGKGKNAFKKAVVTLAVPKNYKKDRDEDEPNADFPRIEFIGDGIADYIESYFSKGKPASIQASFRTFTWEDEDGDTQYGQAFDGIAISFVPGAKSDDDDEDGGSKRSSKKTSKKKPASTSTKKKRRPDPEDEDELDDDEDFEIDDEEDEDIPF